MFIDKLQNIIMFYEPVVSMCVTNCF